MSLSEKYSQTLAFLAYFKRVLKQLPYFGFKGFKVALMGYTPNKSVLYPGLLKKDENKYVSDYQRYVQTPFINYNYKVLFNDKLVNYYFLSKYTDKICPILCYIDYEGNYVNICEKRKQGRFVYKPNNGWGGKGIEIKENIEKNKDYKNYIIVPFVTNHQYAKSIFPKSLNTIRLLTCIIDNEVHIIACVHRFGTEKTNGVDNFTGGGISCLVNIDNGIIDSAVRFQNNKKFIIESHPDTNSKLLGVQLPKWDIIKEEILELHSKISFIKYIGWDIAITPNSYSIIEANHVSDLDLLQCHGGILNNNKSIDFYKSVL